MKLLPVLCLGVFAQAPLARAQTAATAPHYFLDVPMFASGNDPYSFSATPAPNAATTNIPAPPAALPEAYSFENFRQNVHGYVSAGVATHDGHNFEGAVEMPLVPGKVDLAVGAATGQQGGFAPYIPGAKRGTLTYDQYYAALHIHPADDFDATIVIAGGRVHLPTVQVP